MSEIKISLDGDALREATVQALMGVLTPDVKEQMIQKAITAILQPSTNSWEKHKSPIEKAFQNAVDQLARDEAKRLVEEEVVIQAKVKELLRTTSDKVLGADTDKLADRMADAFVASMRRD